MFYPVPNVDSAVVRIDICPPKHGVEDLKLYRSVVRAAFLSRRKTLANNLMQAFKMTRIEADGVIAASGINSKARGETLSTEGFARLTAQIANFKK